MTGNHHFGEARLLSVLKESFEQGPGSRAGYVDLEDTIHEVRRFYEKHGFARADVKGTLRDEPERTVMQLAIQEGPKVSVRKIACAGNTSVRSRFIRRHLLTHKRSLIFFRKGRLLSTELEKDVRAVRDLYISKGFLDVRVTLEQHPYKDTQGGVVLLFRIEEGPRYVIGSTTVRGATSYSEQTLLLAARVRRGTAFTHALLSEGTRRISRFLQDRGHLDCRVESTYTVDADYKVEIVYTVEEGPVYTSAGIVPSGSLHTRLETMVTAADLPKGSRLGPAVLERSRKRLRQLGIFDSIFVKPVPVLEVEGVRAPEGERATPVVVSVRERKRLTSEVGIRYDSDLGMEAFASFSHENLFGRAQKTRLYVMCGQKESQASMHVADPMVAGYGLVGALSGSYKREVLDPYKKETTVVEASIYRTFWDEKLTPSWHIAFEHASSYDIRSSAPDAPLAETTNSIFAGPRIALNFTDDLFYPTRGWHALGGVQSSMRAWGSDANLVRYNLQVKYYVSLAPKWIMATSLALDAIEPFGSTTKVPSTNLLFAGGNNSVRGFPKDSLGPLDDQGRPLGGTTRILANIEVRFPIYRIIHGVMFLDAGSLRNGLDSVDPRLSAGGGIRLHTPVGPIRAEYGYQLKKNPPLSRGEFIVSLGFPF